VEYFSRTRTFELEVTKEEYNNNIHDTLSISLYNHINEYEEFKEFFNIRSPTRLIKEDSHTPSWQRTEDWAITGSYNGGELIIGQSVSCREKKPVFNIPKELIQIRSFENRLRRNTNVYQRLNGLYTLSVNGERDSVKQREKEFRNELKQSGSKKLPIIVRELEKTEDHLDEAVDQILS